ncbi:PepSY domain-containing protein [Parerythrobacter aestuarii]|uniref:PepSY domain-containing protein n=1 Tax=Parerythrobacter aestuarii TaxID=3020909 RepID=UPI0024DE3F27|nr:PepSY domain-containing protein [Parerythrobacter aestuarii]
MARKLWMQRFAKWHIWLGWLVGVPVLMWTLTGLVMVIKPIEEVRGNHLRVEVEEQALPPETNIAIALPTDPASKVRSVTTAMQGGRAITTLAYADGTLERYDADGRKLSPLTDVEARLLVAEQIKGGDRVQSVTAFSADAVPFDFRRPVDVWQVALADGTHVYVGQHTGKIESVRTRWWRVFDFMWGLHIMDLQMREDTSHPILILFAILGVIGSLLGCILMFRRRKARVRA